MFGGSPVTLPDHVALTAHSRLSGTIRAPGDKSISHRALILSALTEGTSQIVGLSQGGDVADTMRIVSELGAEVRREDHRIVVQSNPGRLRSSSQPLDCGNSGTGMRLLMGMVASIPGEHVLIGDASLSTRPMDRIATPLRTMGATVRGSGDSEHPPITITGSHLHGIRYQPPMASAQVKSALLLAGLRAKGTTAIIETVPTRPHTEEMLAQAGAAITVEAHDDRTVIEISPSSLRPQEWVVPADPSQAAFFVVAGTLSSEGSVTCTGLYGGATRVGFLGVLERMGAVLSESRDFSGHLEVTSSPSTLQGTEIEAAEIPSLDEVPILAVAAAAAEGVTVFRDVGELRFKESDRLEATANLVRSLGAVARIEGEMLVVEGLGTARRFAPLELRAEGDHRMAMAAAIAGTVGTGATIDGFSTVGSSYPNFLRDLEALT